ncbi:sigma-E processing peptidase SpoIIGA [Amphibacillus sediminis]|uniref:sigma-E processing peptidase SpoIIGA n=1 Tax=Amphibacillus sediminis TaxID=360185 RepID=UPI00082A9FDB|nr:sigma-E processing peptidase SpoIIGA [Amphibacillus sediminis]
MMTIYLDVIWILNICIDFMIIQMTGHLVKSKTRGWSLIAAALFASLIVFITVYAPGHFILTPLGKLLYSCLILLIAFGFKSITLFIKTFFVFYFVTFAIGGALFGLHYLLQQPYHWSGTAFMTQSTGYGTPISWLFVIIGFPICWFFTRKTMDKQALTNYRSDQTYQTIINLADKTIKVNGYLDSANHLTDPISGDPVVLIDLYAIEQLFEQSTIDALKTLEQTYDLNGVPADISKNIHLIPFRGIDSSPSILVAFRANFISLECNGEVLHFKRILVGLKFSYFTTDQLYHCLLNPELFKKQTFVS